MSLMTTPHAPHPDHDPAPEPARSTRRTLTLVVSVVVLLILVAGGTVAVLASRGNGDDTSTTGAAELPSAPPASAAPEPDRTGWGAPYLDPLGRRVETPSDPNGVALAQDPSGRPPAGSGRCPAEATDPVTTTFCIAPPQGVMWQQVDGVPMPFSTSDGPTAVDGELPAGFAQTPQGAALAAQQLTARSLASKAGALAVTEDRMVFDTAELRQTQIDRFSDLPEWPAIPLDRIEAYKLTYWAADYAVVEIASTATTGTDTWTTGRIDLLWKDGDWWIKGGPQPGVSSGGTTPTLAGWTAWPSG